MTRLVSLGILGFAALLAGCSAAPGSESSSSPSFTHLTKCDPSDPTCDPTDPGSVPCDPTDTACQPQPGIDPCAAQQVKFDASCTNFLGYAWDGKACNELDGCQCTGPDCGALFKTEKDCVAHYAACGGGGGDFCTQTAKELTDLLAQARACNIAAGAPVVCDGTSVPTISGCPVPVASGSSDVTQKYLGLYAEYAKACPLPVPACPDPKGQPVDCVQDPNVDGLMGVCSVVKAPTPGAASD